MYETTIIQRALLTVYDKSNIIELAERLHLLGVELISTGNTAALLSQHGLPVVPVSEYTGFPEMMQGRLKTLHPKIHGGILGRRDVDADIMLTHGIPDIDLVVVNLYPFKSVIQKEATALEEAIENIDIGGPTLIRGAAKNYEWCTVLVDPNDYPRIIKELEENKGAIKEQTRFQLAAKAFAHTADYDNTIARYLGQKSSPPDSSPFSETLSLSYRLKESLRYGENPHQKAAFYQEIHPALDAITQATQCQGKALSFNNIVDADTALECVKQFIEPACVIVKHANPCGVAIGTNLKEAYDKAYACDPTSAFGGILAFNGAIDEKLIQYLLERQFVEVLIASSFTPEALLVAEAKPNCRLLQYHPAAPDGLQSPSMELKSVNGGVLIQSRDAFAAPSFEVVTKQQPTASQLRDLRFCWDVAKFVKSNAIVFARNGQTLGIGAGQMSRIFSTEIAQLKAQAAHLSLENAVMASDAFFPFKDNVEKAHTFGVKAIVQPGGSKRDDEVIACANDLGMVMVMTGVRHFRH